MKKLYEMSQQTRILLATAIALLFFIPYSYFFTPEPPIQEQNKTVSQTDTQGAPALNSAPNAIPSSENAAQAAPLQSAQVEDVIASIRSEHFTVIIDKMGRISQVLLKDERFLNKDDRSELELFNQGATPKILELRYADAKLNDLAFATPYSASSENLELEGGSKTLSLTQKLGDITVEKVITFHQSGEYDLEIKAPSNITYFLYPGSTPNTDQEMFAFKGSVIGLSDGKIEKFENGDFAQNPKVFIGSNIAASADRYYTTLLFSKDSTFESVVSRGLGDNPDLSIRASGDLKLQGYIGPKEYAFLKQMDPKLTSIIDYGMITFFAKPLFLLLMELESIIGNWGWAIVLLTFLVRVVLYPLTYKGMVSMQKLKELAPKIKELQVKYKDDKQKMQVQMMEIYKKHGANPLGGCLPILLQMPIFFAIYMVLYNAIELKGASWILWINDLSAMDPYFILPLLMGGSMYLHQVLTPTTFQDPMQEKIFKFLPLIFTFFFLTFPSGLVLYWFVNNVFSIAQQYAINKSFERKKLKKESESAK